MDHDLEVVSVLVKTWRRKFGQAQATRRPVAGSSLLVYRRSLSSLVIVLLLFGIGVNLGLFMDYPWSAPLRQVRRKPPSPLRTVKLAQKNTSDCSPSTTIAPPSTAIAPPSLTNPTIPANSFFYIVDPKPSYKVCDVLELYIEVRDGQNMMKTTGGDLLWPFIRSTTLKASGPADQFTDHGNGSYTARLTLSWTGLVEPVVSFIHSAEYVAALRGIVERVPNRFVYVSKFTASGTSEYAPCHMNKVIPYIATKPEAPFSYLSLSETCDYSDASAGTNWYCLKPKTLPCSAISLHRGDWRAADEFMAKVMTTEEAIAWKAGIKEGAFLSNRGSGKTLEVIPGDAGNFTDSCLSLPACTQGLPPKPPTLAAGYYYQDSWKSKVCRERTFHLPDILKCLRGKNLYFYGDSTLRQWSEFLVKTLSPTMKAGPESTSSRIIGPLHAVDAVNNITLTFRHHDFPIRNNWLNFHDVKFTVNEIDALPGGPNTVVLFTFWAHFTTSTLTYYRSRMERVKAAVQRLHRRGTGPSPVFFKSANTRADGSKGLYLSDFHSYRLDQVMRELFIGVPNVTIIDAWGMTLSHRTGYRLHPTDLVIREEVKMVLNFLC